jgi:signal transduction histidine kinase
MTADHFVTGPQLKFAAGVALLFVIGSSFLFSLFVLDSNQEIERRAVAQITRVRDSLAAYEKLAGFDALIQFLKGSEDWREEDGLFVSIADRGEKPILHTALDVPARDAWKSLDNPRQSMTAGEGVLKHHVYVTSTPLSKGRLLVGRSDKKEANNRRFLIAGFALTNAAAMALLLFLGMLFSRRSRSRIEAMKSALATFTAGDIDCRVKFPGPVDALYELAYAINSSLEHTKTLVHNLNHTSSDIAHNLKKPMTRLRQRLELVSSGDVDTVEFKAKIEEALEEIDSLIVTFEALLNIGQLQSGDRRSRFTDVNITALFNQIIEIYEPMIVDSGHYLETAIPTKPVGAVRGDRELLMEMFVNFVENAILHCPPGTTIRITLQRVKSGIEVIISDNGPGIPSSEVENVFRRFYRLDASRTKPGHGLGVPSSVAIAELHDAVVELSDNKPGLKVTVLFPSGQNFGTGKLGLRTRSGLRVYPGSQH